MKSICCKVQKAFFFYQFLSVFSGIGAGHFPGLSNQGKVFAQTGSNGTEW